MLFIYNWIEIQYNDARKLSTSSRYDILGYWNYITIVLGGHAMELDSKIALLYDKDSSVAYKNLQELESFSDTAEGFYILMNF